MASTTPLVIHLRKHHKKEYHETFEVDSPSEDRPSTSRQATLLDYKKWKFDDKKAMEIHTLIGEMICLDNHPFNIVEHKGFGRLLSKLAPNYSIPSRTYFRNTVVSY